MRVRTEANMATIMRPSATLNSSSRFLSTARSDSEWPGLSALVLSIVKARTPFLPIRSRFAASKAFPSSSYSILKSPKFAMLPTGVLRSTPVDSGMV